MSRKSAAEKSEERERPEEGAPERDENEAAEQVAQDLDEQHQRRPQTPPPDLKRERDEYLELAQRTRADFDNYRKRVAREAADALQRGKGEFARELLPVLDNLERA